MGKDKTSFRSVQVAPAPDRSHATPARIVRDDDSSSGARRTVGRSLALVRALLVALLFATGSISALADKGGRPAQANVPDVNLGLGGIQNMGKGVGPLVPSGTLNVAPGLMREPLTGSGFPGAQAPGASALTPANGLTPPGHLDTPGLGLGRAKGSGLSPATEPSVPGGNGFALGRNEDSANDGARGPANSTNAATARSAAPAEGSESDTPQSNETPQRAIPICR